MTSLRTLGARARRRCTMLVVTGLLAVVLPIATTAQSGGTFTLRKSVIAGGGQAAGGPYSIVGTIGQPAAGISSGGPFVLQSGFHAASEPVVPDVGLIFCSSFEDTPCP